MCVCACVRLVVCIHRPCDGPPLTLAETLKVMSRDRCWIMDGRLNQNISIFDVYSSVNLSNKTIFRSLKEAKDSEIFKAPLSCKRKISITFILMSLYQGFKLMTD